MLFVIYYLPSKGEMMDLKISVEELGFIKRRLNHYRRLFFFSSFLCALILAGAIYPILKPYLPNLIPDRSLKTKNLLPPHSKEVSEIMSHLSYSATRMFIRRPVGVTLDFEHKTYTLRNIHRFDPNGNLVLEESAKNPGQFSGACGELAAYTYEKVKPILGDQYNILFVRSGQSGFFLTPDASHILLKIIEKNKPKDQEPSVYILDPSFKRYGPLDQFEDYQFFEERPSLPFVENKETDLTLPVGFSIPLWIEKDYLVSFVVEGIHEKFNSDNFGIALLVTKRHAFMSRYVLALQKKEGQPWDLENEPLIEGIIEKDQYQKIRKKITDMFHQILEQ